MAARRRLNSPADRAAAGRQEHFERRRQGWRVVRRHDAAAAGSETNSRTPPTSVATTAARRPSLRARRSGELSKSDDKREHIGRAIEVRRVGVRRRSPRTSPQSDMSEPAARCPSAPGASGPSPTTTQVRIRFGAADDRESVEQQADVLDRDETRDGEHDASACRAEAPRAAPARRD